LKKTGNEGSFKKRKNREAATKTPDPTTGHRNWGIGGVRSIGRSSKGLKSQMLPYYLVDDQHVEKKWLLGGTGKGIGGAVDPVKAILELLYAKKGDCRLKAAYLVGKGSSH